MIIERGDGEQETLVIVDEVASLPGAQGVPGPTGPAGPAGPQGDSGYRIKGSYANVNQLPAVGNLPGDTYLVGTSVLVPYTWDGFAWVATNVGVPGPEGPEGPAGPAGAQGPQGEQGPVGPAGDGFPSGGATSTVLRKTATPDFETEWAFVDEASLASTVLRRLAVPGDVRMTVRTSPQTGWAFLQGQTINSAQTLYPTAWANCPSSWRSGSNLVLPDARQSFPAGFATGVSDFDPLGGVEGANTVTLTEPNLPEHEHSITHDHTWNASSLSGVHSHGVTDAGHGHSINDQGFGTYTSFGSPGDLAGTAGGSGVVRKVLAAATGATGITLVQHDGHTHDTKAPTHTGDSGLGAGTSTPVGIAPKRLVVNFEIYLG